MTARTYRIIVVVEVGVALVLGSLRLGHRSVWLDEAVSVLDARLPWPDFVHRVTGREANMSLYYLVLRGWRVVAPSPAGLRLLSVIAGAAAVPFVMATARRLASASVAVIAGLLLVVNPMFLHYAQEIRGYQLCLLLVSVSSYLFVRGRQEPRRATWAGWAVVSAAAGYAHSFAVLVIAGQLLSLAFTPRRDGRDVQWRDVPWRAIAGYALLSAPLAVFSRRGGSTGLDWIKTTNVGAAVDHARSLVPRPVGAVVVALALVGTALVGRRVRWRPSWPVAFVTLWFAVPVVGAVAGSYFVKPMFVGRYVIAALPALAIAAASAVVHQRTRAVAAVVVGATVLALAPRVVDRYRGDNTEDWRHAAAYVLGRVGPGDGILFNGVNERILFEYYLTDAVRRDATPLYPLVPWRSPRIDIDASFPRDPTAELAAAAAHARVWLVNNEPDAKVAPVVDARLRATYRAVDVRTFRHLRVTRYERA